MVFGLLVSCPLPACSSVPWRLTAWAAAGLMHYAPEPLRAGGMALQRISKAAGGTPLCGCAPAAAPPPGRRTCTAARLSGWVAPCRRRGQPSRQPVRRRWGADGEVANRRAVTPVRLGQPYWGRRHAKTGSGGGGGRETGDRRRELEAWSAHHRLLGHCHTSNGLQNWGQLEKFWAHAPGHGPGPGSAPG